MTESTIEAMVEKSIKHAIEKTNGGNSLNVSSNNTLMDLRLVILRTIADVWKNDQEGNGTLRGKLEDMTPVELNQYFLRTFSYRSPYENFGTVFIKGTAQWNWYGDNQWTKAENETLTITLPSSEKKWDEYERAMKLTEYYNYFPSFFGASLAENKAEENSVVMPDDDNALEITKDSSDTGIDLHGNDYNLGVSEDSFLSFGAVVIKLIAAAWANQGLMNQINYDYRKKGEQFSRDEYYKEINELLIEYYQFKNPWSFNLKFIVADKNESFWKKNGHWRKRERDNKQLIRNQIALEIPIAPRKESTPNISMALARYNAIGPAFPFTCS